MIRDRESTHATWTATREFAHADVYVPAVLYHRCGRRPLGPEVAATLEQHLARRERLAVKRSIFIAAGGLDEKAFPVAFNDIDLCLKVRALGYRNVVTPFAELFHFESSSRGYEDTPEKRLRFAKGMQVMRDRHGGDVARDPCYSPHLAGAPDDFLIAVE